MLLNRRARVVWLIDSLGMGGAERLTRLYLQHFELDRFEPRLCFFKVKDGNPLSQPIQQLGIPVDRLPIEHLRDLTALPRLIRYLRQHKADLVHTQLEFSNTLGNLAAKFLGLPSLATLHTLDSPAKGSKAHRRLMLMWWAMRNFCDRAIGVSEGAAKQFAQISGIAPGKLSVLYNGIDLEQFAARETRRDFTRESLSLPPAAQVLLTVAVLRELKGIQYLIQALPAILTAHPNVYYVVVGDGEHGEALRQLAASSKAAHRIIFVGMRSDIPDLLAAADIFVLPSLIEALPTVLAEAMAARKPIIATRVGGVPEMVADGVNGVLATPADSDALAKACITLLSDPARIHAMGEAGWARANQQFRVQTQLHRLGDLYDQLLFQYRRLPQ